MLKLNIFKVFINHFREYDCFLLHNIESIDYFQVLYFVIGDEFS